MAFEYKVGNFQLNSSIGAQSVTGVGFQPKVVLFLHNSATVDIGVPQIANHYGMVGASDGTTHRSMWWHEPNGNGGLESTGFIHSDYPICGGNNLSTNWYANLTGMTGDGFNLNITTAPPDVYRVGYLAMGGADVTNTAVGEFSASGALGLQAVGGLGFQPTGLIIFSLGRTDALKNSGTAYVTNAHTWQTFGFTDGTNARCSGLDLRDASLTVKLNGAVQGNILMASPTYTAVNTYKYRANISSFDAGGFTVNWLTATTGRFFYLAFAGPTTQVGFYQNPTSTGIFQPISGLPFQPNALITTSSNQVGYNDIQGNGEVGNGPGAVYSHGFATSDIEQFNTEATSLDFTAGATYSGFYQSELAIQAKYQYNNRAVLQEQVALDSFGADYVDLNALTTLGSGTSAVSYMVIEGDGGGPEPPENPTGGSGDPNSPDSIFLQRFIGI
jgi:hypothetical protein